MPLAVLGIDAAWTARKDSGVCLLVEEGACWRCLALASSYAAFLAEPADADVAAVMRRAASLLGGARPDVVAVDMPLARVPITGRRAADSAISRAFGVVGCSTHSPGTVRPGPVGEQLQRDVTGAGYRLVTSADDRRGPALIEVYPHPAILRLLDLAYRLPYKAGNAARYWPQVSREERRAGLLEAMQRLAAGLRREITDLPDVLASVGPRTPLKGMEDMLDAAVCAWVGMCYLKGTAEPFGDEQAAIWVPTRGVRR